MMIIVVTMVRLLSGTKSNNINEVKGKLGQFLTLSLYLYIFFFTKRFCTHQKQKKHKNATKQKYKNASKRRKMKTSKEKTVTYSLIRVFALFVRSKKKE